MPLVVEPVVVVVGVGVVVVVVVPPVLVPPEVPVEVLLLTLNERTFALAWLPAASRATHETVWVPLVSRVEFNVTEYGAAFSSAPRLAPSSLNCTPVTPMLSVTVALTLTDEPETVALAAGAEIATVGAVVSDAGGGGVEVPPLLVPPAL